MNYQRILSYLYDYDRGVKRKNIGFVKIETRGDLCRVNIHMKLPGYLPPERLRVYFFLRRNDELPGILIADVTPTGIDCDVRAMLPASFFEVCGLWPEEFAGVYICQEKQKDLVFVSAWDDEPVYVETFRELQPKEKETPEENMTAESETSGENTAAESEINGDSIETEKETSSENVAAENETCGEDIAAENETGSENTAAESEPCRVTAAAEEKTDGKIETAEAEADGENTATGKETAGEKKKYCRDVSSYDGEIKIYEKEPCEAGKKRDCGNEPGDEGTEADVGDAVAPDRGPWEELAKNFTKFRIVDGDTSVECLKIRPHHLALLPRRYWDDTNNSFLLHGYYAYGHIILARSMPEEKVYLGIPGKNRDRDRVMAGYYGYVKYVPTGRKNHGFGYWCREITL